MSNRTVIVDHEAPPNYEFAGQWKLKLKGPTLIVLTGIVAIIFVLTIMLGFTVRGLLRGYLEGSVNIDGFFFLILLGVFVVQIILHEGIHGALFQCFGGKPRYGVKLVGKIFPVAFYATSKTPILRNQYLQVCLAPFLMLTPVFLLIGILANADLIVALAIMAAAMNASGSIGDIMMFWKIRQQGRQTMFKDEADGFNWYLPLKPNQ